MKTIKFKSFSSGSSGNCCFVGIFDDSPTGSHCEAGVLIDAGVSPRRVKKELASEGLCFDDIRGILITHDHMDHIRSLGSFCKHVRIPVWSTPVLRSALAHHPMTREWIGGCIHELDEGWNDIAGERIRARYFEVPHDATQTVGYAILLDEYRFVIMTDIGRMTEQGLSFASQAGTVVIESNYDPYMLEHGPYPEDLQARIRGGHGHLSNPECAEAISKFAHEGLRNVFLCHLSEHNNTPELAMKASRPMLDGSIRVCPLPRMTSSPLMTLSRPVFTNDQDQQ